MTKTTRTCCAISFLTAALALFAACADRAGASGGESSSKVARIVFLDRLDGNAAAKAHLDEVWVEVQTAMEDWRGILVERIHIDAEPKQSEKILALRSVDKLPGIYFLDENDALIEMLQGDVKANEIRKVVNPE
jgi:hypothetical protein